MADNELKAIDGTKCSTIEELEKVNNDFWLNIFNAKQNYYPAQFKDYYECYLQNIYNPFEKWQGMYNDFKFLLNRNILKPRFIRIFAGILILYKPEIKILNEYFIHHEIEEELLGIYHSLANTDNIERK